MNKKKILILTILVVICFVSVFLLYVNNVGAELKYLPKENPLGAGVKNIALSFFSNDEGFDNDYKKLITYIDPAGKNTDDVFMDTFVVMPEGNFKLPSNDTNIKRVYTSKDIDDYLDYELRKVDKINEEVNSINSLNNSNIKVNILLSIIWPDTTQVIANTRSGAIKYFVERSIERFNEQNYSDLNLIGFYWYPERIYEQETADLVTNFNEYVHTHGYKTLWIPYIDNYSKNSEYSPLGKDTYKNGYINADCSNSSCIEDNYIGEGYGFDYVAVQSGYYFSGNDSTWMSFRQGAGRLEFTNNQALKLKMGVEVEVDSSLFSHPDKFNRYIEFLRSGVQYGWNDAINTYYMIGSTMGIDSGNRLDREVYDLTYKYATNTLTLDDLDITYSKDYYSNYVNVSKGKSYISSVAGSSAYPDNGVILTDGSYGEGIYGTTWAGFNTSSNSSEHYITIDLGEKISSISYFGIELSKSDSAGVYLPSYAKVYYSNDNSDYAYLGDMTYIEGSHVGLKYLELQSEDRISARYIRFVFEKLNRGFIMVSEATVGKTSTINLLSENSKTVAGTQPYVVQITTDNVGTLNVSSSNTGVATVSLNNNSLVITPIKAGKSIITITDRKYGTTASHTVTVVSKEITGISVKTNPMQNVYFQSTEPLNLAGGEINVTYNNGDVNALSMLDPSLKVTGFDNSRVGQNTITISLGGISTSLIVEIVPKIEIKNIDSSTGKQVAGAKLTVYNSTCANLDTANESIWRETFISSTESYFTTLNVKGTEKYNYCLVQEGRADGYKKIIDKVDFVVERKTSNAVEMVNTPISTYIRAVGEEDNEVLENIEFELYKGQCNGNEWSKMASSWVSATDYYHIKGLKNGEYCLVKKRAPSPYTIGDNVDFLINAEGELIINGNRVHNKLDVNLNLTKTSIGRIDDENKYLAGSVIQIIDDNSNKVIKEVVTTSGLTEVKGLEHGNYRVEEKVAPDGYALFDGSIEITISDRDNVSLILISGYKTEVSISVVDGINNANLSDAEFELRNSKNGLIDSWVSNTKAHLITGLSLNEKYTLIQKKTPDGYISSENIIFKITENSSTIEVKNDPIEIKILIKDSEDNKFIAGVPFVLKDKNGNIVDSWTSNDFEHIIRRLPVGNYKLIQADSVKDYEFSEAETDIEIKLKNEDIIIYGKKVLSDSQDDLIENPNTNTGNLRLIYLLIIGILGVSYPLMKRKKLKIK